MWERVAAACGTSYCLPRRTALVFPSTTISVRAIADDDGNLGTATGTLSSCRSPLAGSDVRVFAAIGDDRC